MIKSWLTGFGIGFIILLTINYIKRGYIWDIQQGLNKEDFIFKTLQEAETKLEELATLNNWIGYY